MCPSGIKPLFTKDVNHQHITSIALQLLYHNNKTRVSFNLLAYSSAHK
jgi:hypothetical protein